MQLIQCDSCNKYMQSNQVQLKDISYKPGRQKRVWYCMGCNKEHVVIIMNKQTRRLMQENKKDRERIGGIHKNARRLMKAGKLKKEQADKNARDVEVINKRIDERTERLDELSRKMIDEYKEEMQSSRV